MFHINPKKKQWNVFVMCLRIIVLRNVEVLILIKTYIIMKKFKIYRDNQHMDEFFLKKGFVKWYCQHKIFTIAEHAMDMNSIQLHRWLNCCAFLVTTIHIHSIPVPTIPNILSIINYLFRTITNNWFYV